MRKSFGAAGLAIVAASAVSLSVAAKTPLQAQAEAPRTTGTWLVWGGEINILFNPDDLVALGLSIGEVTGASKRTVGAPGIRYEAMIFPARERDVLEVRHAGNKVGAIGGGQLSTSGGFELRHANGTVDLTGLAVRAEAGSLFGLAVVDRNGEIMFTADHAHYGFDDDARTRFGMHNMNLRIGGGLAARLGRPDLESYPLGGFDFTAQAQADTFSAEPEGDVCNAPFPAAGLATDIQMVYRPGSNNWTGHDDLVYAKRCSLPPAPAGGSCTGASTTGKVVMMPDSSLRNVGETAVAWYEKFTANSPPYNNDQHPFLIWNLYRVSSDGRIQQIGVSGVKHAFLTINYNCSCSNQHVIYPTCEDTYAWQNNDNTTTGGQPKGTLGPRREIIPQQAKWARCGSIYDANCNGALDSGSGPADLYQYRMNVTESDLMAPLSTGAKYYFEYWYIVRDDQNFYNTMGHREITASKSGSGSWSVAVPAANFTEGPVINRWVDPASPGAREANEELSTPLGRARVAVKVTDLGGGQWRYRYAVMNFDYAHVDIDPAHATEPNLKLTANVGFDRFSVPVAGTPTDVRFFDADADAADDWTATAAGGQLTWTAPAGTSLTWGTLTQFEFTTNAPPVEADVALRGGATPATASIDYTRSLLAPGAAPDTDTIFEDDFE